MTDYSEVNHLFYDFNDPSDVLVIWEGMTVWAGCSDGGMKVTLGRAEVRDDGVILIPFERIDDTWTDEAPREAMI